jgi:apolipoprotein N-acyltransferase
VSARARGAIERAALVVLGTALFWLASPGGPAPVLAFAADAPFLWLLWHRGGERWKRWAYLYGAARFAAGLSWLAVVGWSQFVGAVLLLSCTYVAWGGALRWAMRRGAPWFLTVGVTAVLQEMAQAYLVVKGGMPWPARSLALTAFDGLVAFSAVFGAYGLSFLAAITSAWVSGLPAAVRRSPHRGPILRRLVVSGLLVALLLAAASLRGQIRISTVEGRISSGASVTTRPLVVVQGNVPQSLKHSAVADDANVVQDRHERLTLAELYRLADRRLAPIAVLWPETMVPWPFLDVRLAARFPDAWTNQVTVIDRLKHVAVPGEPPPRFLLGVSALLEGREGPQPALDDQESRDSLVFLEPELSPEVPPVPQPADATWRHPSVLGRHDKRVLVPFAEWTPLVGGITPIRRWKEQVTLIPELTPGDADEPPFLLDTVGPFRPGGANRPVLAGTIICFEIAYPAACRSWRNRGATILLNAGNYGWFGDTRMPLEILALARLRAAECAVTVVIAGNTGPSAIVDPAGRVDTLLEEGGRIHHFEGAVSGPLWSDIEDETFYARWGDLPWAVVTAFLLLGLYLQRRRLRRLVGVPSPAGGASPPGEGPPAVAPPATS